MVRGPYPNGLAVGISVGMRLLLLFSFGTTLQTWKDVGFLDREHKYYSGLLAQGVKKVSWLTYGREDRRFEAEIRPIEVLPRRGVRHLLLYSLSAVFVHWQAFRQTDLIKSNQSNGAWVGLIAKLLLPGKRLVTRCGWVRTNEMMSRHEHLQGMKRAWVKSVEWLCYKLSDAVIVTTPSDRQFIVDTYGIDAGKVKVIPNTVDTELFSPSESRKVFESNPIRVLSVGRLVHMKNYHNLIAAVSRFNGALSLTLVGGGDEEEKLKGLAAEQSCTIKFVHNTKHSDLPSMYRSHDIFIMPQVYASGMSKVMIEAMACGLITIGSDLRSHREVIEDGVNGFLCGVDADAIGECLQRIIDCSPKRRQDVATAARRSAIDCYSLKANISREYSLYTSLVGAA